MIRDTLEADFDIFSINSGVSSHAYDFNVYGPRILEWTFNNILLPDSTTNEAGSHGFITFTVEQNSDLANGTELNNNAGIYFDYNDPIITNETSHIVDDMLQSPLFTETSYVDESGCDLASYNGIEYTESGTYYQLSDDGTTQIIINASIELNLEIVEEENILISEQSEGTYQWIDCVNGNNSEIVGATSQSFTPETNGSYAVEITNNDCTGISECYTWIISGVDEHLFGEDMKIIPNPNNGNFELELVGNYKEVNVKIIDSTGRLISQNKYANTESLELNIDAPTGVYFLILENEMGESKVLKVIKY